MERNGVGDLRCDDGRARAQRSFELARVWGVVGGGVRSGDIIDQLLNSPWHSLMELWREIGKGTGSADSV